jgi:hypothetical protein
MTPDQAIDYWQELQRALSLVHVLRQPPTHRRRRCGEMRVTMAERLAMRAFYLDGRSYTEIARLFRRDRHYVRRWVWSVNFAAFYAFRWGQHGSDVTERADQVLARMQLLPPREAGSELRPIDKQLILSMRDAGDTQERIAVVVGCSQATVSRTIADYVPTGNSRVSGSMLARIVWVVNVVENGSPELHAKMLGKVGVVAPDGAAVHVMN